MVRMSTISQFVVYPYSHLRRLRVPGGVLLHPEMYTAGLYTQHGGRERLTVFPRRYEVPVSMQLVDESHLVLGDYIRSPRADTATGGAHKNDLHTPCDFVESTQFPSFGVTVGSFPL